MQVSGYGGVHHDDALDDFIRQNEDLEVLAVAGYELQFDHRKGMIVGVQEKAGSLVDRTKDRSDENTRMLNQGFLESLPVKLLSDL